jgi:hypothetical protein
MADRGSCPVCDMLFEGRVSGICTECATGEIGHSYKADGHFGCAFETEYLDGRLVRCKREMGAHFS